MNRKGVAVVSLFTGSGIAIGYALFNLLVLDIVGQYYYCTEVCHGACTTGLAPPYYCEPPLSEQMTLAFIALVVGGALSVVAFKLGFMRPDQPLGAPRSV